MKTLSKIIWGTVIAVAIGVSGLNAYHAVFGKKSNSTTNSSTSQNTPQPNNLISNEYNKPKINQEDPCSKIGEPNFWYPCPGLKIPDEFVASDGMSLYDDWVVSGRHKCFNYKTGTAFRDYVSAFKTLNSGKLAGVNQDHLKNGQRYTRPDNCSRRR
jgi:hypothetical protein